MTEFDKYIVHGEPGQKEKADAWQTATESIIPYILIVYE